MQRAIGSAWRSCRHLLFEDRGNVAVIFGLTLAPVMLLVVLGVDYARIFAARSNLQQATDAAALAVAKNIVDSTTGQQAQAQAQVYLANNARGSISATAATISSDRMTFCLSTRVQIMSAFSKLALNLAGVGALNASANACAKMPGGLSPVDTYEIALVLDNSGSMSRSTNGMTKMQALQSAATSFVGTMFSRAPGRVQFAVTPFAGAVVAVDPTATANRSLSWIDVGGDNSQHWIAFGGKTAANAAGFTNRFGVYDKLAARNSRLDWRGCFEALAYPYNVQDTATSSSNAETLFVPYLAPDEPDSDDDYRNSYIDDDGASYSWSWSSSVCSDTASGDWNKLEHVCKYKTTSSLSGSFGPTSFFGPNQFCPDNRTQAILQLNSTQSVVNDKINRLVENGNTNLHEGLMWGWRTISPVGPFAQGRAYGASGNHKVIVFMTDGFNNWGAQTRTVVGSDYEALGYYTYNGAANARLPDGSAGDHVDYRSSLTAAAGSSSSYLSVSRAAQDELTLEACANAKAAGVEIYTIGFSIPADPIDEQGLALLQACATNSSHYFAATDVASLNAAFSTIGTGLGKLRLSQ
ncbi:MAG: hypothetical protein C3F11_18160 [Methylocystaceae bacterium]|nr:MAG: hypothetical protein C3F11_18160 [Methylocystaceae bacterium]